MLELLEPRVLLAGAGEPPIVTSVSICDGSAQRSMVQTLTVTFSEEVQLAPNAMTVSRTRGEALWDVVLTAADTGDSRSWDITFSGWEAVGGSLPDGLYQLTITPEAVSDLDGNALVGYTPAQFHRLFGDTDGDRDVDDVDLRRFSRALDRPAKYAIEFDHNSDGVVDVSDLDQIKLRMSPASSLSTVMNPGGGFTSDTPTPSAIGAGPADTAVAIAHWDTVPNQEVTTTRNVAVVAFHYNGINRVEFSADGGPWVRVYTPSLNPETGVIEYWATLDASRYAASRPTTVRARIYPNVGVPRVLQDADGAPMEFYVNKAPAAPMVRYVSTAGSDLADGLSPGTPMQTLQAAAADLAWVGGTADGGIIYCMPGSYALGSPGSPAVPSRDRWLTITSLPGVPRETVVLSRSNPPSGINVARLRLYNLTVRPEDFDSYALLRTPGGRGHRLWLDQVTVIGPGDQSVGPSGTVNTIGWEHLYATGIDWGHYARGPRADLVRDSFVHHTTDDIYTYSDCVINSRAHGTQYPGGFHNDIFQSFPSRENVILYGVTTSEPLRMSGGLFQGAHQPNGNYCEMRDVAVVNCAWDTSLTGAPEQPWAGNVIQLHGIVSHLLLVNSSFIGPTTYGWTSSGENDLFASDSLVRNCSFDDGESPSDQPGFSFPGPDVVAPSIGMWTIPAAGTTITGTLSEGCGPASGTVGFSLIGTSASVNSWSIDGLTLTLHLAGVVYQGQTVALSHTGSTIADASGNPLPALTPVLVRNASTQTAPGAVRWSPAPRAGRTSAAALTPESAADADSVALLAMVTSDVIGRA